MHVSSYYVSGYEPIGSSDKRIKESLLVSLLRQRSYNNTFLIVVLKNVQGILQDVTSNSTSKCELPISRVADARDQHTLI